ncbi:MAG: SBBP repeat-containing protein, partial [Kiritimatiellia bacterium]
VNGIEFGFALGEYDRSLPLIIDPLLSGTFVGGTGDDIVRALTKDNSGNIYAAGYTSSETDFPTGTGAVTNYQGGAYDAFVMKYDANTHELLAATFLGGTGTDQA